MKLPTLSSELEHLVLSGIIQGLVPLESVTQSELSRDGQKVYAALKRIAKREPILQPLPYKLVLSTCVDALGCDRDDIVPYLKRLENTKGTVHTRKLLEMVQEKQRLVALINTAGEQLSEGELNVSALREVIDQTGSSADLSSVSTMLKNGIPKEPTGLPLKHLPGLRKVSGGLFGLWAIAGAPGIGKSTLGLQLALEAAQHRDVFYYDFENGQDILLNRIGGALGGSLKKVRALTERLYLREDIRTLDADLRTLKKPGVIVIDSFQKLPADVQHRRTSLDKWLRRFEMLKKNEGHAVVLLSEKDRGTYDAPSLHGFKETGEIEYSADFGAQMVVDRDNMALIEFHVVKNRHRPHVGHVLTLRRANAWWFKEMSYGATEED